MTKDLKASMPSGDPTAAPAVRANSVLYLATSLFIYRRDSVDKEKIDLIFGENGRFVTFCREDVSEIGEKSLIFIWNCYNAAMKAI